MVGHTVTFFQVECEATGDECHEEALGVEWHDVVEVERDASDPAEEYGEVVDSYDHTDDAFDGEVLLLVEVEEVAKAGHPYVAADEDADPVVGGPGAVVVVHDEGELHPALPLLGLGAREEGDAGGGGVPGRGVGPGEGGGEEEHHVAAPEHVHAVVFVARVRRLPLVSDARHQQNQHHLALRLQELSLARPIPPRQR